MLKINEKYGQLADQTAINKVVKILLEKGVRVEVSENSAAARKKIFEIIPEGAEVMNMTSITLKQLGADKVISESGKFNSTRQKFAALDKKKQNMEMKRLGAAPEWAIGSAHALTEDGILLVASATGSQLPAYAYGANNVLWVIGSQKIVKNLEDGLKRIYEYTLPLENERALKAYGANSGVNKILIINKESVANRLNIIIVKEKLGF